MKLDRDQFHGCAVQVLYQPYIGLLYLYLQLHMHHIVAENRNIYY